MSSKPQHFVVLDSWRGIAACVVALAHFKINSHFTSFDIFSKGGLSVDLFFVLSGFVIFANYAQRLQEGFGFWRFMGLRLGRLYPLHFVILMMFVSWELLQMVLPFLQGYAKFEPFGQPGETLWDIILSLTLTQGMGTTDIIGFNGPSWSISTEFYTYALFALILVLTKSWAKLSAALAMLGAGAILFYQKQYFGFNLEYAFVRCVYGFSAGALLWYLYEATPKIRKKIEEAPQWKMTGLELLAIALFYAFVDGALGAHVSTVLFAPLVFGGLIFLFCFERGAVSNILKTRFFVFLGITSYSIYMTHTLIGGKLASAVQLLDNVTGYDLVIEIEGKEELGHTLLQGDIITLIYFGIVFLFSYITYRLIENPSRILSRNLLKTKRQASSL